MAPVYINNTMLMLVVDTSAGASKMVLAKDTVHRYFTGVDLGPSCSTFCTADSNDLHVARQFVEGMQLGPVTVMNLTGCCGRLTHNC